MFKGHNGSVGLVVFSPDGQQLASVGTDFTVKLWNTATGTCLMTFWGHCGAVGPVIFSPNGQHLASVSVDSTVKLWNTITGDCLMTFRGHHAICSVTFSPGGQQLLSPAGDNTIRLLDIMTDVCLATFCLQTIHRNTRLRTPLSAYLDTKMESTDPKSPPPSPPNKDIHHRSQDLQSHTYGISNDGIWITYHAKNLLWLPSAYRPYSWDVRGSTVGIGCLSGRV